MSVFTYTGRLSDFSEAPFPNARPRLWVAPILPATTKTHALATKPIELSLSSGGLFSVDLVASADTYPQTRYRLRCEWLDSGQLVGWSEWEFTALIGGGSIGDMTDQPVTNVWYSTRQPPLDRSGIYWINPVTGDVREWV